MGGVSHVGLEGEGTQKESVWLFHMLRHTEGKVGVFVAGFCSDVR